MGLTCDQVPLPLSPTTKWERGGEGREGGITFFSFGPVCCNVFFSLSWADSESDGEMESGKSSFSHPPPKAVEHLVPVGRSLNRIFGGGTSTGASLTSACVKRIHRLMEVSYDWRWASGVLRKFPGTVDLTQWSISNFISAIFAVTREARVKGFSHYHSFFSSAKT